MGIKNHDISITLAALLHDIGKFYQRTGDKINSSFYESFTKNGSYRHAAYTAQFISDFLDEKFGHLLVPSASHHTSIDSIIKKADIIAAGHDRKSEEALEEEQNNHYITGRMYSIFSILFDLQKNNKKYINLSKQQEYFASDLVDTNNIDESKKIYKSLFRKFLDDLSKINPKDQYELHQYLYPLIKEYTTTIPSSTYKIDVPTISLYDHLKLTSAIANCLCKTNLDIEKPFMIVEYDMSGIQSYIYKITEGTSTKPNIAKSLRTRSFYLSILCDFITYAIANEFDVTYENILYTSGGRGQVLIPNTIYTEERLQRLFDKITLEIFNVHFTDLSFAFSTTTLDEEQLQKASFKKTMYGDSRKLCIRKNQKYLNLLKNNYHIFDKKPLSKACSLCEENEATGDYCSFCNKLLDLNDRILAKYNQFVIEFDYANDNQTDGVVFNYGSLGRIIIHQGIEFNYKDSSYYETINRPFIGETKHYAKSNITGMTFENLANQSEGDKKLAVIKMDVDNLGWIFHSGFEEDLTTISKILTLSRNMDFFFSKIIVDIANKYPNKIYIIYSGGDDLAIVLPASDALQFVNDIYEKFNEYTGNPEIHLSTGIEIFLPKSPIRFAINRAEEELENAKRIEGKNSLGIFEEVVSNKELPFLLEEIKYYKDALNKGLISRTGLYNIYLAIALSLENKQENAFQRYIPQIAYSIARNIENHDLLIKVKETFVRADIQYSNLQKYKIIYAYVLMSTREVIKNE